MAPEEFGLRLAQDQGCCLSRQKHLDSPLVLVDLPFAVKDAMEIDGSISDVNEGFGSVHDRCPGFQRAGGLRIQNIPHLG
jgi:hypothetical protein